MRIIGYDIETAPQDEDTLSQAQKNWLETRMRPALEKNKGIESEEELRRKIMGTTAFLGKIVCISVGEVFHGDKIKTASFTGTEKELLEKFWDYIAGSDQKLFVSFNGLKFDVSFISLRSFHHGVRATNGSFLNTIKFRKYPHFDIMAWMSDWGWPAPTLDVACNLAGIKSSKEGAIKAKDVTQAFLDGRIEEIAAYCEDDVRATLELYLKYMPYVRD